jgi:hypothetical protein
MLASVNVGESASVGKRSNDVTRAKNDFSLSFFSNDMVRMEVDDGKRGKTKKNGERNDLTNSVAQEPEGSTPHTQQPAIGPCPEPVESNPHPPSQSA